MPATVAQDAFYVDRYCYVVGPWFDLFDMRKQFTIHVPHLSLSHQLLYLSLLACAAKQYYLSHLTQSADASLLYYDRALRLITESLNDVSVSASSEVLASCVLLAECEMMGDCYQNWHLHIEGIYSLITAHGWHGCSGGLPQACFWVYCRMDLLSSLAAAKRTHLDTSLWLPRDDALAPADGSQEWSLNAWSNYTVLLLAQIHDLLCEVRVEEPHEPSEALCKEWNRLRKTTEAHERRQPLQFKPLIVLDSWDDKRDSPFPCVRYPSEDISAANQLFDLARLLLILARPTRCRSDRMSHYASSESAFLTFVNLVVGNSIHNRHELNWVCAVQLLSSAGMCLTGWRKRMALLKCLKDIHVQTGWNTRENIQALLTWWGWAAPLNERGQNWTDVSQEIGPQASIEEWMMRMYDAGVIMAAARRDGRTR